MELCLFDGRLRRNLGTREFQNDGCAILGMESEVEYRWVCCAGRMRGPALARGRASPLERCLRANLEEGMAAVILRGIIRGLGGRASEGKKRYRVGGGLGLERRYTI